MIQAAKYVMEFNEIFGGAKILPQISMYPLPHPPPVSSVVPGAEPNL